MNALQFLADLRDEERPIWAWHMIQRDLPSLVNCNAVLDQRQGNYLSEVILKGRGGLNGDKRYSALEVATFINSCR